MEGVTDIVVFQRLQRGEAFERSRARRIDDQQMLGHLLTDGGHQLIQQLAIFAGVAAVIGLVQEFEGDGLRGQFEMVGQMLPHGDEAGLGAGVIFDLADEAFAGMDIDDDAHAVGRRQIDRLVERRIVEQHAPRIGLNQGKAHEFRIDRDPHMVEPGRPDLLEIAIQHRLALGVGQPVRQIEPVLRIARSGWNHRPSGPTRNWPPDRASQPGTGRARRALARARAESGPVSAGN